MAISLAYTPFPEIETIAPHLATEASSIGSPHPPAYVLGQQLGRVCRLVHTFFFPSPMCHKSFQEELDSHCWRTPLSATPPRPTRSHPIQWDVAEKWLAAQISDQHRNASRALLNGMRHVTQEEFEQALAHSVGKFNDWLDKQPSQDYLLLVSRPKKSNRWVAELALPHLKHLPKQVIDFTRTQQELLDYYWEDEHPKQFLFLDDAAYSGAQVSETMTDIIGSLRHDCGSIQSPCFVQESEKFSETKRRLSMNIVIPFVKDVTDKGLQMPLYKTANPHPLTLDELSQLIRVFTSEKLPTVKKVLTEEQSQLLKCPLDRVLIYFDHKMADEVSTCPNVFKDFQIHPHRHQDEDLAERSREYARIHGLQFIDPIHPPYKKKLVPQGDEKFALIPEGLHKVLSKVLFNFV